MTERGESIPENQERTTISEREANDMTREYIDTAEKVFDTLDKRSTLNRTVRPTRRVLAYGMNRFLKNSELFTILPSKDRSR